MITDSRANQNSIRVNFIPSKKKEDENAALATPLSFSGTPDELDRELGSNLASYVEESLRLQCTLAEAKAEMEAAAKTARDQARAKSTLNTKKREDLPSKGPGQSSALSWVVISSSSSGVTSSQPMRLRAAAVVDAALVTT